MNATVTTEKLVILIAGKTDQLKVLKNNLENVDSKFYDVRILDIIKRFEMKSIGELSYLYFKSESYHVDRIVLNFLNELRNHIKFKTNFDYFTFFDNEGEIYRHPKYEDRFGIKEVAEIIENENI